MNIQTYFNSMLSSSNGVTLFLSFIGIIIACIELFLIARNRRQQYEYFRREKTVDMVIFYVKNRDKQIKAVEKIVAGFREDQCQDLYDSNAFIVDENTKKRICPICPMRVQCKANVESNVKTNIELDNNSKSKGKLCFSTNSKTKIETQIDTTMELCKHDDGHYWVENATLDFLRSTVISYLNLLESVLLSWQLAIVDQKTIEEQFAFLDRKPQKERALEIFRRIAGHGQSYPAIERFYQYLEQKREKESAKALKKIIK